MQAGRECHAPTLSGKSASTPPGQASGPSRPARRDHAGTHPDPRPTSSIVVATTCGRVQGPRRGQTPTYRRDATFVVGRSASVDDELRQGGNEHAQLGEEVRGCRELRRPRRAGEGPQAAFARCTCAEGLSATDEPDEIGMESEQRHDLGDPRPADPVEPGQVGPVVHHSLVEGLLEPVRDVQQLHYSRFLLAALPLGIAARTCRIEVDDYAAREVLV